MVAIPAVNLLTVLATAVVGFLTPSIGLVVPEGERKWREWVGLSEEVWKRIKRKATGLYFVWILITAYILGVFIKLIVEKRKEPRTAYEIGYCMIR